MNDPRTKLPYLFMHMQEKEKMKQRKKLTQEEFEVILIEGDRIHVIIQEGDSIYEAQWPRAKVMKRFEEIGAELSSDESRAAGHGIVSCCDQDSVFFAHKGAQPCRSS